MNTVAKLASSRTVWTLIAIFIFNGLQGLAGAPAFTQVSPHVAKEINGLLTVAGMYFRLKGVSLK